MSAVLQIQDLCVSLPKYADRSHAIYRIHTDIAQGETLCIVGESGSGKSVLATTVMGLLAPNLRVEGGSIKLKNHALLDLTQKEMRALRGKEMGMVFQEPMTALNPVMTCADQLDENLRTHTNWSKPQRRAEILRILEKVQMPNPERMMRSYPHQLSGGQRQRIVIAMALILQPVLLICDEPTTALDVTTQKEILKLIKQLQVEQNCA
ncbi:MAG: ABC transporter ATP-binding protein, partial [Gammaproteobacteria bacterium]|nr:ABC transporter ATP-binding protein [Gammaproteobacteria bacterium]